MAITNYTELKTQIADWLHRTDLELRIPEFVYLAERKISNNIRSRELEIATNLTLTAGVNSVDLPLDYCSMKSIQIEGTVNSVLALVPADILLKYNAANETGLPQFYSIQNNTIHFSPIPSANYTVNLVYYQDIPSLSGTNPTNWVLTDYPYIYLYGALIEAAIFTNDPDQVDFYQRKFSEAISDMWQNHSYASFSGSPLFATSDYIV